MKDFRELKVWARAHELTLLVYQATGSFPREEMYGLTSQLRRAAASVPANLAEGCGRNGDAEFARFCFIAMGSASELDYHMILARDLKMEGRSHRPSRFLLKRHQFHLPELNRMTLRLQ